MTNNFDRATRKKVTVRLVEYIHTTREKLQKGTLDEFGEEVAKSKVKFSNPIIFPYIITLIPVLLGYIRGCFGYIADMAD